MLALGERGNAHPPKVYIRNGERYEFRKRQK
jgi:hypothetical protein